MMEDIFLHLFFPYLIPLTTIFYNLVFTLRLHKQFVKPAHITRGNNIFHNKIISSSPSCKMPRWVVKRQGNCAMFYTLLI